MKKSICIFVVLLFVAGMLQAAQNNAQSELLGQARAVVDKEGKQGIPGALKLIEKALEADPGSELPHVAAARLFLLDFELNGKGDSLTKALAHINKAIQLNSSSTEARICKALVLLDMKASAEAVNELKQALKLEPGNFEAGVVYMAYLIQDGQRKQAKTFAEESLAKVSNKLPAAKTYGRLMLNAGYWEEALFVFAGAAADGAENDPEVAKGSALAFSKMGKFKDAAREYDLAYTAEPGNKELLLHLSICYEKAGDLGKAADYLREYVGSVPRDEGALRKLASIYEKLGDSKVAGAIRADLKAEEERREK